MRCKFIATTRVLIFGPYTFTVSPLPPVPTTHPVRDAVGKATSDVKKLTGFDASSKGDLKVLRPVFEYGGNAWLGMREEEILIIIETLDRVNLIARYLSYLWNTSDLTRFQVLKSSLNDTTLHGRCLRGLQQVSARCGLLPKSYWNFHGSPVETNGTSFGSQRRRVSGTSQWLVDGRLVAAKAVSPDYMENVYAFKRVSLSPPQNVSGQRRFMPRLLQRLCTSGVTWK